MMTQKSSIIRLVTTSLFLLSAGALGVALNSSAIDNPNEPVQIEPLVVVQKSDKELAAYRHMLSDSTRWVVLESEAGALERVFVESDTDSIAVSAAERLVDNQTQGWPEGYRRDFLESLSVEAIASGVANELPPSVTLAQAVLESGWGRSGLATQHNNLIAVKTGAYD